MSYVQDQGNKIGNFVPRLNGNGQKVYRCIAGEQTSAKVLCQMAWSASGPIVEPFFATAGNKPCFPLEDCASGDVVDCVVAGYIPAVQGGSSGKNTTACSTYTKGSVIIVNATGWLIDYAATWTEAYNSLSTAAAITNAALGITLSSGPTATINLFMVEKPFIVCCNT